MLAGRFGSNKGCGARGLEKGRSVLGGFATEGKAQMKNNYRGKRKKSRLCTSLPMNLHDEMKGSFDERILPRAKKARNAIKAFLLSRASGVAHGLNSFGT